MKDQSNQDDAALSRVLQGWKVSNPLPPRFQENVWRKIEQKAPAQEPAWLELFSWFRTALSRPALAASYVALLLVLGSAAGYFRAQAANARADHELSARYVQMVDPYQPPGH
jgi:hypothetical protein